MKRKKNSFLLLFGRSQFDKQKVGVAPRIESSYQKIVYSLEKSYAQKF